MPATKKRNFYKSKSGRKKTLKQTIRPTHKKKAEEEVAEEAIAVEKTPTPKATKKAAPKPKAKPIEEKPPEVQAEPISEPEEEVEAPVEAEPVEEPAPVENLGTQAEIDEMKRLIESAASKLKDLEEKKAEEEKVAAEAAQEEVVEEFNGLDTHDEEMELLRQEIKNYQKQNKKLKHELDLIKKEFDKDKKTLERQVKGLKKELHRTTPIQDNKFFSFSKELREAVDAIKDIETAPLVEKKNTLVLNADQATPTPAPTQLTQVEQPSTPAVSTPDPVATPAQETTPPTEKPVVSEEVKPASPETVKADEPPKPAEAVPAEAPKPEAATSAPAPEAAPAEADGADKKKKGKEKKLLITGMVLLGVMLTGGLISFRLTSEPKINEALVQEYLEQNSGGQVQGAQSPKAHVPNGIIADKDSEASFEESQWERYKDNTLGFSVEYPANVVERLHTPKSVTFLRKDGYLFKVQRIDVEMTIEDYWESVKDVTEGYVAEAAELDGAEVLHLIQQGAVEFPGNRYLIGREGAIFDVWYATPSDKFSQDDMNRVDKMVDTLNITY